MVDTSCLFCDDDDAEELFPERLNAQVLEAAFSARRRPDNTHYRIVRCGKCGLVRSNPIFEEKTLNNLYRKSGFTYPFEASDAALTYKALLVRALDRTVPSGAKGNNLLEIGCGNGAFLELAAAMGFEVKGVEPSSDAVNSAPSSIRNAILTDCFEGNLFGEGQFGWVCCFHVIDHLAAPDEFLEQCLRIIAPGGYALFVCHNVNAFSSRLLGEKSPIVDIEHIYLFSIDTLARLFKKAGFEVVQSRPLKNKYRLDYWLKMAPFPRSLGRAVEGIAAMLCLSGMRIGIHAGNQWILARKPC